MDDWTREFAKSLGADIVAELPDVGHGALGAAHYAEFYRRRMAEIRNQDAACQFLQVPLRKTLRDALDHLAQTISEPGKLVTREDVALLLLCEAVERMLDDWLRSRPPNDQSAQDEVQRRKSQIDNAKKVLCESIGLIPNRSAVG